jgi:hypothetical protein
MSVSTERQGQTEREHYVAFTTVLVHACCISTMKSREKSFWIVFYIIKSTDIYYVYIISKSDQQNRRTGMRIAPAKATYSASHFKVLCGMYRYSYLP